MLLLDNATATITRQLDNGEFQTVLDQARANVQTDSKGQEIVEPWARGGTDEAGKLHLSNKWVFLGGPDENPDYEPKPGDQIEITDCPGFNGTYRQVADTAGGPDRFGLSDWKLPAIRLIAR